MNIPYLNFWIDLNNLFLLSHENKYIGSSIVSERLTLTIIDDYYINVNDYNHGGGIYFTKVEDSLQVEDRSLCKEYTECDTEPDVVAFLKLCSNDTNFLKIKDIPYPEIFSLPSKSITLLKEYF